MFDKLKTRNIKNANIRISDGVLRLTFYGYLISYLILTEFKLRAFEILVLFNI